MTFSIVAALILLFCSIILAWRVIGKSSAQSKNANRPLDTTPKTGIPPLSTKDTQSEMELFEAFIRSEDPQIEFVVLKIGIAEMRIWLQFQNNCVEPIIVESVAWTFWFGKLVKSGKFTQKIEVGPKTSDQYMIQEVVSDEELREIVRLKTAQHPNFYMEGIVYCNTSKKSFQKKFAGFNLRYHLVGYSETAKSPEFNVQTHLDSLTGLLQRRFLDEHLQTMIDTTAYRRPLSFIMIDIDDFKGVNDAYGHLVGDDVIKAVCSQIKDVLGEKGLAIRFGGDEFGIVLESFDSDEAKLIAEKMRQAVASYKFLLPEKTQQELTITLSIGVATLRRPVDHKVLIDKADKMLYESKKKGKNQVSVDPY